MSLSNKSKSLVVTTQVLICLWCIYWFFV